MANGKLPIVLMAQDLPAEWIASLEGKVQLFKAPAGTAGVGGPLLPYLPAAEGLLSMLTMPVDQKLLARMPVLRVVSNMAVGVNNIDLDACTARGIPVGHTPGLLTDACADLTLALLLVVGRGLPTAARMAREGQWHTWRPTQWLGSDFRGKRLGIVGMGRIGEGVAERAKAFGMEIVYYNRSQNEEAEKRLAGAAYLTLDELLATSDFVTLHTPLTDETHHLIDERRLRQMQSHAVLINLARGPVVDTAALLQALREGWIGAAGLDVTDPEPLPPDHPLYELDNCYIVPHIGSATHQARRGMAELACENLLKGLAGERLTHTANPAVYDRE